MKFKILLAMLCLPLLGCYVQFEDGKVPEEYLNAAKKMTGTFYGQIENEKLKLHLEINKTNQFLIKVYNNKNEEILLSNCGSTIKQLLGADINSKSKMIRSVEFEFEGTKCGLSMDGINLQLINEDAIQINLVKKHHESLSCSPGFGDQGSDCSYFTVVDEWITGQFFRQN